MFKKIVQDFSIEVASEIVHGIPSRILTVLFSWNFSMISSRNFIKDILLGNVCGIPSKMLKKFLQGLLYAFLFGFVHNIFQGLFQEFLRRFFKHPFGNLFRNSSRYELFLCILQSFRKSLNGFF